MFGLHRVIVAIHSVLCSPFLPRRPAAAQFPSANASIGWSAFTSIFTTPAAIPAAQPDVLYLFPGLQVRDARCTPPLAA